MDEFIGTTSEGITFDEFAKIPLFMTVKEAAYYTRKHAGSIRRDIETNVLPADKINGKWLICKELLFPKTYRAMKERGLL